MQGQPSGRRYGSASVASVASRPSSPTASPLHWIFAPTSTVFFGTFAPYSSLLRYRSFENTKPFIVVGLVTVRLAREYDNETKILSASPSRTQTPNTGLLEIIPSKMLPFHRSQIQDPLLCLWSQFNMPSDPFCARRNAQNAYSRALTTLLTPSVECPPKSRVSIHISRLS